MVELPERVLLLSCPIEPALASAGEVGDEGSCGFACSFASADARSSGCTSLLGGSSFRISQPKGGLGGGEMKKTF